MHLKSLALLLFALLLTTGCANKAEEIENSYNKPAEYWYNQMIKYIRNGDLDKADDAYTSLSSEHVASPLLKSAMLIMAKAHDEDEQHIMARFYIDTYIKRYANSKNIEYLRYLKLKSLFTSLKKSKRDQKLLIDTINRANRYIEHFPNSPYLPKVHTMLTKLYLGELLLNREIAKLYKKLGKKDAAKIYKQKVDSSWLKDTEIDLTKESTINKLFN